MTDTSADSHGIPALRLLEFEQAEFERFLHDDLGQSLVALRSMAAALGDGADGDIVELVSLTANDTYAEVYDRMTELRAEALAQEPEFVDAVRQCLDDARLESKNLAHRLAVADGTGERVDPIHRRLILRGLRCLVNVLKRTDCHDGELRVNLATETGTTALQLQLQPDGFPDDFLDHPRLAGLASRLQAFGGHLTAATTGSANDICLRLPAGTAEAR